MTRMKMNNALGTLVFLCVLVPCIFSMAADKKNEDNSSVEIVLSQGQKKVLTAPLRMSGRFEAADFTFRNLSIENIASLVSAGKDRGRNIFLLTLAGNEEPLSVSTDEKAEVYGTGEWGKETIALSRIASLTVSNPKAPASFKPESKWLCKFTTGKEMVIGWSSKWASERAFAGQVGNASLQLDAGRLAELSFDGSTWTLLSGDRSRLHGWQPKQESLVAGSSFGEIEVPWVKVSKLSSQRGSAANTKPEGVKPAVSDWLIEIAGRFSLPITDIQTGSNDTINDELNVKSLNWAFIDRGVPNPTGIELLLANKKVWVLRGSISGISPFGSLVADCKEITKLERINPAGKNRKSSDYDKKIIGTITTSTGTEYAAGEPELEGGEKVANDDAFFGYGMFQVPAPPVEIWLRSESLMSNRLTTVDGKLVSNDPKISRHGPLAGFTELRFTNTAGKFGLPVMKLSAYTPQASPLHSKSVKTQPVKYRITVRDPDGKEFTGEAAEIEFARYPSRGWVGSYPKSSYPFQWHLAQTLYFKKESGEQIDVAFDRLKKIEISGNYGSGRPATLTSAQGSEINGSIYPGDVAKSYPGISDWNPQNEGLLCRLADGEYVYVQFREKITIEIQQVTQK